MTATACLYAEAIHAIQDTGYCILPGLLPRDLIDACAQSFFAMYDYRKGKGIPDNRGPHRNYLDVPFSHPFSDPRLFENPTILEIVEGVLGSEPVIIHYGTDTPELGSEAQGLHADGPPLFPESEVVTPAYALAVNFPLVDVHADNGPFEVAEGTHLRHPEHGLERIARGEVTLKPLLMRRGDVMIRDPRTLHRGSSNRTEQPRPMVVVAYQRPWLRHRGFEPMRLSPAARDVLSPRARKLLSLHLEHDLYV
jgi:hypothetical protein